MIYELVADDSVALLELANVHSRFDEALRHGRTATAAMALGDLERGRSEITKETLIRLLKYDVKYLDRMPRGLLLSLADENDGTPTFPVDLPMKAFSELSWLTVASARLEPSFLKRVLDHAERLGYVELDSCFGNPFDGSHRPAQRRVPFTLRCVNMRLSLTKLTAAFGPTGRQRAVGLRYAVFKGCVISRKRRFDGSWDEWLRLYGSTSEEKNLARHLNLATISDRWDVVEPFDYSGIEQSEFLSADEIFPDEEPVFFEQNRLSMSALKELLRTGATGVDVIAMRFSVEQREDPLDPNIGNAEAFKKMRTLEIHNTVLNDAFLNALLNNCECLVTLKLRGCRGATFAKVRVTPREQRWQMLLSGMYVDPENLVKAVEPSGMEWRHYHFDYLELDRCEFDEEALFSLIRQHGWLRVRLRRSESEGFVDGRYFAFRNF